MSFSQLLAPIVLGITSDKIRIASVMKPAINASQLISVKPNTVRELDPKIVDVNAYPFTPFTGTPLRATCEKLGYVKKNDIVKSIVANNGSILNMPQFTREDVSGLVKTVNL